MAHCQQTLYPCRAAPSLTAPRARIISFSGMGEHSGPGPDAVDPGLTAQVLEGSGFVAGKPGKAVGPGLFEILWIKNGAGNHRIDMHPHPYRGSVLFMLSPGQLRSLEQEIPPKGYLVRFSASLFGQEKEFLDSILDTCLFDHATSCPVIPVPARARPVLEELFSRLVDESLAPDADTETILSAYLRILLARIRRLKREKTGLRSMVNGPAYASFRTYILAVEKEYRRRHSVRDYAALLRTGARALNAVARKYSDRSAGEVIQDRLALEAQRSLARGSMSIKEVCFELGFSDPAYFSRFFKRRVGLTPQEFLERARAIPA